VEDGRNYLQSGTTLYDIITAEPPPPREAGVVNLYSREYYEILKRRLTPGGLAVQWVPLSGQSVEESRALIRTFSDSFPEVSVWLPTSTQLVIIGSDTPVVHDLKQRGSVLFGSAESRKDLASVGFRNAEDLLAVFVAGNEEVRQLSKGASQVTDAAPVVEYFRRFGSPATGPDLLRWLRSFAGTSFLRKDPELDQKTKLEGMIRRADWVRSVPLLEYALSRDPDHLYLRRDLSITNEQRDAAAQLRQKNPDNPDFWDIEARIAFRAGDLIHAQDLLKRASQKFPQDGRFVVRLSDLYRSSGRFTEAKELLAQLVETPEIQKRLRLIELSGQQSKETADLLRDIGEWAEAGRMYRQLNDTDRIAEIENAFLTK
jgi:hypothetical protein